MKASDYPLYSGILSRSTDSTRFVVPVYQRNYDWQYEHCEKLLTDIIASGKMRESHFLGSLVTVELNNTIENVLNYVIIDGQQRLTTIFLILRILIDIDGIDVYRKEQIKGVLNLYKSDAIKTEEDESRLRLKLIKTDAEQLNNIFNSNTNIDKNSNIVKNYGFLKKLIQEELRKNVNSANIIFDGIERLNCVWIRLDSEDKPQEIFESINSTGMELSISDLIRNYLLMTEVNQDELYENYWLKIETNIMKVDPKNTSKNLSEFFRHYLSMKKNTYIESKNTYKYFVQYMNRRKENGETNEEILCELLQFSKIYTYLLLGQYPSNEEINYYLYKLNEIKQTTIYPFLLILFYNMENGLLDACEVKKTLHFLLQYFIRRLLVGYGTNGYNKEFASLYSNCCAENEQGDYTYSSLKKYFANHKSKEVIRIPFDSEVENTLKVVDLYEKSNLCKPILEILENSIEYKIYAKGSGDVDFSDYNIEHIMPQNIGLWKQDLENIPDWQEKFDALCGNIGNLTLTKLNSEMSNKRFREKKYEMGQAKDQCDFLQKEIYENDVWNFEVIEHRQKRLIKRLLNVLHIELPEVDRKEYYTLDDNLTDQKIVRFTIKDKSYDVNTITDFFLKILQHCFDVYAEDAMRVVDRGECKQFIAKGENAWQDSRSAKPKQVCNGIYANTHGNSNFLCKNAKKFLNCINEDLAKTVKIYRY